MAPQCLFFLLSLAITGQLAAARAPLYLAPTEQLTLSDDYDTVSFPSSPLPGPPFAYWKVNGVVNSTGRSFTAHVGQLSGGLPATYSYRLPKDGCCHRSKTSTTAQYYNCTYATNAGFFSLDSGCCIGNLIIQGDIIQLPATVRANFGLINDSFISGYLSNKTLMSLGFLELASGAGWIVRKGLTYVNESVKEENINEGFVTLKAPRTAIAAHNNGSLYLVEVDGVEHEKEGVDLYEFSEILIDLGVEQAVNLDGGGSSVSVYKGQVISKPTCIDTSFICEREVTSITCMTTP